MRQYDRQVQLSPVSYRDFAPRYAYLEGGGRRNFFWRCLLSFSYFRDRLPHSNIAEYEAWLNERLRAGYGIGIEDFLYFASGNSTFARENSLTDLSRASGLVQTKRLLEAYSTI